MSGMAQPPTIDLTSTGNGYPYYANRPCPVFDCRIESAHSHGTATHVPTGELVRSEGEINRLTRALAERDAECRAHMEMRYNAERERDEARTELSFHRTANLALVRERDDAEKWLETNAEFANHWRARAEEAERVLIAFHRQEGEGLLAVKRLAKRLHEASAPKADLSPAGYFSPAGPPSSSYGGTE